MKYTDLLTGLFPSLMILLPAVFIFMNIQLSAQSSEDFKVISYKTDIGEGKNKEVNNLFEGSRRKIAQLTLRNGESLGPHSVEEPITIQCVAGSGELIIGKSDSSSTVHLEPGVLVTVDENVPHDVKGNPSVSILLSRFLLDKKKD